VFNLDEKLGIGFGSAGLLTLLVLAIKFAVDRLAIQKSPERRKSMTESRRNSALQIRVPSNVSSV
jgi:hypothetical protein